LGLYESPQEILVGTFDNYYFVNGSTYFFYAGICSCAIYLFYFLILVSNRIREVAFNSILVVLSAFLGLLVINQFFSYLSKNNNQKQDFPRKLLNYLEPVARWSYPDFKNSETNTNTLFIVGDSYAKGAGDLFLKESYKNSIGHFWIMRGEKIQISIFK